MKSIMTLLFIGILLTGVLSCSTYQVEETTERVILEEPVLAE